MPVEHFAVAYADRMNLCLHIAKGEGFFRQEIIEVPGLVTALLVTWDGAEDDVREIISPATEDAFLERMALVKPDWRFFSKSNLALMAKHPEKTTYGYEGRTIYILRGGSNPDQWKPELAREDAILIVSATQAGQGPLIEHELKTLSDWLPPGKEHFQDYERFVRVVWNYLFIDDLGEGQAQSRTGAENEGVEIRDLIFSNRANSGFWKDLKDKYAASEIVVDAKNTDNVSRNDLRQLYCYLKPVLGFCGFIVTRAQPSEAVAAFNRSLCKNFRQERVVLILTDKDLMRMVMAKRRGNDPTRHLQRKMSEFVRSI